jgi:two-component system, response regulator FlrC
VREIENTMHRAVLLASGDIIGAEAVMLAGSTAPNGPAGEVESTPLANDAQITDDAASDDAASVRLLVGRTVADVERDLIVDTLYHCLGNRTHAANILGISIRTLRNKLKQYTEDGVAIPIPGEINRAAY